jgi:hypothetical protein
MSQYKCGFFPDIVNILKLVVYAVLQLVHLQKHHHLRRLSNREPASEDVGNATSVPPGGQDMFHFSKLSHGRAHGRNHRVLQSP